MATVIGCDSCQAPALEVTISPEGDMVCDACVMASKLASAARIVGTKLACVS